MKNFLNTPYGSFLKVFIAAILVFIIKSGSIWGIDWKQLLDAATLAVIPVIINFFNPADTRYGVGSTTNP
jgi:Na+/citrate or Na+/malate symporter